MKRILIILMALALGLSMSAQRGRYSKGRKPVRTTQRVTPRPATTIKTCPDNNHPHAIDLGLPSGTKWACCNVGATKPTSYGNYYAWGETKPKAKYGFDYKWGDANCEKLTKYCTDSEQGWNGFTDNKTILELADDAAHANWGGEWCMPDSTDFEELIKHTAHKWVRTFNGTGVKGLLFTGKNGKHLFLPAAGSTDDRSLNGTDLDGCYWSSSLEMYDQTDALGLWFYPDEVFVTHFTDRGWSRCSGYSVRPVCNVSSEKITTCSDNNRIQRHPAVEAKYPGNWIQYLQSNLKYPASAIELEVQGIVRIEFVVGKDGSISQMKVLKDAPLPPTKLIVTIDSKGKKHYEEIKIPENERYVLADEAMRVIRAAKWTPGKDENGNPVTSIKVQEIQFVLQ